MRRDEWLAVEVSCVHAEDYGVYGVRKVGAQLNREEIRSPAAPWSG